MKKTFSLAEGLLQSFIALGAMAGGIFMIIRPDGSLMHMPLDMLKGSPFKDFLIPGIILFSVNGLGNALSSYLSFKQHILAGYAGIFFGMALTIWIFVQVSMIGGGHWLQYLYFSLGILETLLGFGIREKETRLR
jgi:hypothetical protein